MLKLGQQPADASDRAQEAVATAFEKADQFRGATVSELTAWVLKIADNGFRDSLRKKRGRPALSELDQPAGDDSGPSDLLEAKESIEWLERVLNRLHACEAEAIRRRYLEEQSVEQIARHLGRSHSAVGGLLKLAMTKLRSRALESSLGDDQRNRV